MIKTFTQKINFSWFFLSLFGFVLVLPFSQALVSILGGVILFAALVEDSWKNKIIRFKQNLILLFIPGIYGIYLLSFIVFLPAGFYDYGFIILIILIALTRKEINDWLN